MPFLAAAYGHRDESEGWDERPVRDRLLARIRDTEFSATKGAVLRFRSFRGRVAAQWAGVAAAACVLVGVALGAYHLGGRTRAVTVPTSVALSNNYDPAVEKQTADKLGALQTARISRLQVSAGQQEIARLRDALQAAESRSATLLAAKTGQQEEFRRVSTERDKLAGQLHDPEQASQLLKAD
jgi:hypothetical protein